MEDNMNMPGFFAEAALEPSSAQTGLSYFPEGAGAGVQLARPCCENCESVCDNQGWDSRNCKRCMHACMWCNFGPN